MEGERRGKVKGDGGWRGEEREDGMISNTLYLFHNNSCKVTTFWSPTALPYECSHKSIKYMYRYLL